MATIVVFQHGPRQTPGRLGMTLRDHGFRLDVRRLDLPADHGGRSVPSDLDNVHGVISLGGSMNVGDPHPWLAREIEYLRAAHDAQIPVIGVCLGHQMIAKALGGEVGPMASPETGFGPVDVSVAGQTHTIMAGVPWRHHQFQSHAQEVKRLPPGATLLASSERCRVQAFTAGVRTFGFQFHFEVDRHGVDLMAKDQSGLFAQSNQDAESVSQQADKHYEMFARISDRLCVNIATFVFAPTELLRV